MKPTVAISSEAANFRFELVRWSIFVILMLTYILVYFHRMAPGVVSEFLMADFQNLVEPDWEPFLPSIARICPDANPLWSYSRHPGELSVTIIGKMGATRCCIKWLIMLILYTKVSQMLFASAL